MKKMQTVSIMAAALMAASCCFISIKEKGAPVTESVVTDDGKSYSVGEIRTVTCNIAGEISCSGSDSCIVISAPARILENIIVTRDDEGAVTISAEKGIKAGKDTDIKIRIGSTTFSGLTVNGAAEIKLDGIRTDSFGLQVNGAADAELNDMDCDSLSVLVNGAGDVKASGKGNHAKVRINGVGNVDLKEFTCPDIDSKSAGVGVVRRK